MKMHRYGALLCVLFLLGFSCDVVNETNAVVNAANAVVNEPNAVVNAANAVVNEAIVTLNSGTLTSQDVYLGRFPYGKYIAATLAIDDWRDLNAYQDAAKFASMGWHGTASQRSYCHLK